jgi:UDP-N-acetylmuramate dehydrogenase
MKIIDDYPLSKLSAMRLGGKASHFVEVSSRVELRQAVAWARSHRLPLKTIGGGYNVLFTDRGFNGLIIVNHLKGIRLLEDKRTSAVLEAAASENWDDLVELACQKGLTGVEAMSLIPGTVGAAPVQNIGCYGQELALVFLKLEALDIQNGKYVMLDKKACRFRYRTSIFKSDHPDYQRDRYIITKVLLKLTKGQMEPPFYATFQRYLDDNGIKDYSPLSIRRAMLAWRSSYLPDPKINPNVGSFFKNPIVTKQQLDQIIAKNPSIADWPTQWYWPNDDGTFKVAAGRLADHLGLKGWKDETTGMGTWHSQALIFVNFKAKHYSDLKAFLDKYRQRIRRAYGIELEMEPEIVHSK